MDISSIPKKYGGELDFECGMLPSIDPAIRHCLNLHNPKLEELLLTGPTRWIDGDDGEMMALSVGSINGKQHNEVVATLQPWASRTTTRSSAFQSNRNRPDFYTRPSYTASQTGSTSTSRPQSRSKPIAAFESAVLQKQPPTSVQPVTQTDGTMESESVLPNGSVLINESAGLECQAPPPPASVPPNSIAMPPPQIQRTETQYMTPATEPSEMKNFS